MRIHQFTEELTKIRDQFYNHMIYNLSRSKSRADQLRYAINYLYEFMAERGIKDITSLTQKELIKFQYYLYQTKQLDPYRLMDYMKRLNMFCRYLINNQIIWKNPFNEMRYIKPPLLCQRTIKRYYNLQELKTRWANDMRRRGTFILTVQNKLKSLEMFISYLNERGIKGVYKIQPETLNQYGEYLAGYKCSTGCNYSTITQIQHLRNICSFLLYLDRQKLIKVDPSRHISFQKYYRELNLKYLTSTRINPRKSPLVTDNPEINELFTKFIQYHLSRGGSQETVKNYVPAVQKFYEFISKRGITDLKKVTKQHIMDFQAWLADQKTDKGIRYTTSTVLNRMISLRSFFKYLTNYGYLTCNHSANIELPKRQKGIPRTCMTEREIGILLNQPNMLNPVGYRDKVIMEVLYSTGIRAKELVGLKMGDIDFNQGLLRVDEPKGGKGYERIIPIGKTACEYVKQYISKIRPLLDKHNSVYLFLSHTGRQLRRSGLSTIVRKYLFQCGLRKKITTHSFRVTCATHMLKNRADISYVQQQLGHKDLSTTQGYIRLIPRDLKEVHSRCHPREGLLGIK